MGSLGLLAQTRDWSKVRYEGEKVFKFKCSNMLNLYGNQLVGVLILTLCVVMLFKTGQRDGKSQETLDI